MIDGLLLAVLALGDLMLLMYLRDSRTKRTQSHRVMQSLSIAVKRENESNPGGPPSRWAASRRTG
jgi:hypothetical protein